MEQMLRPATLPDVERMIHLAEQEFHRMESHRDPFYATGPNLAEEFRTELKREIESAQPIAFVMEEAGQIKGFVVGQVVSAPPVYNPGGKVCLVDFLCVAKPQDWSSVGRLLAQAAEIHTSLLGGILVRVECRRTDDLKRKALLKLGYSVASDWLYRDINLPATSVVTSGEVLTAKVEDVPAIVALCEQNRKRYESYQPVFWRKANDSSQRQAPYLQSVVEQNAQIVLIHRTRGAIDGAIIANPTSSARFYDLRGPFCSTDDFAVAEEGLWETVGLRLLAQSVSMAQAKGANFSQVICADGDTTKLQMLRKLGYVNGHEWLVRECR